MSTGWSDIHCHLLPGIDDGAADADEALKMARIAVEQGTSTIVVTPHQLGIWRQNEASDIRRRTNELQELLNAHQIPLVVLPGGEIRIEDDMPQLLDADVLMTLGDHKRHVLVEQPFEIYFPLEPIAQLLKQRGLVGILAHPERNRGIMAQPGLVGELVDAGWLVQVTTGSLTGAFGPKCQQLAEEFVRSGCSHFLSTDAHGPKSRRPLFRDAYQRATELAGEEAALAMCRDNPRRVAEGREVNPGRLMVKPPSRGWRFWKRVG
ncbi:tyrosine-protein phosphatase [Aeoliella mucimassa]|uniref:protein-tyrosine-phosphatase n=1 Tax=Aeoliella mucimassa TaxID=2527972 RepID=A0A518ARR9_9BACT|nr:CpsB/CapC family capsule biosynthesis tyrosine phosphatase [Aeoliella mucimassa]QDU57417.1 Tyrosine-protein phosphatase YwqE [Aeoliella mucimassa]